MTTILILINVIIIISSLLLIKTFKKITSDARDDAYYYYRKYQSEHQIKSETIAKMNELKNIINGMRGGGEMIKVTKWISYEEADKMDLSIGGTGGFFSKGMRWKDYIEGWGDKAKPYAEAIRNSVIEQKLLLTGYEHQNSQQGAPLFSDNTAGTFSFRAWGDLMAAIWSEETNIDYSYMDFYMPLIKIEGEK